MPKKREYEVIFRYRNQVGDQKDRVNIKARSIVDAFEQIESKHWNLDNLRITSVRELFEWW